MSQTQSPHHETIRSILDHARQGHEAILTDAVTDDIVESAARNCYAEEACPDDILGMSSEQFSDYVEYIADRRLTQLDMNPVYGTDNPFPWMSEQVDLNKEKNFFESTVREYQDAGSLDW